MSEVFTLDEEPTLSDAGAKPTKSWQPSQEARTFSAPAPAAADGFSVRADKSKRGKKVKPATEDTVAPVKLLPAPKPEKKLSKKEQAKAEKAQLAKVREADAAAMRINGVDGDVEIPKKPWLTVFSGKRARPDEVAETLTDLASMLESGESEHKAVSALAEQYADYDIGQAYERVVMLLDRGVSLGGAMSEQTDSFPSVVRELIGAAKMPKDMHRNLRQAALIIVEADTVKSQIKSALFKPGFLLFFLVAFTLVSIQWLLPMTAGMFTDIGAELPAMTQTILTIGGLLKWVLLAVIIVVILFNFFWIVFGRYNERIATIYDTQALKAPLVGDIMRMSVAARFCDVLAACLSVGMSEIEALETAARACGNRALKRWVDEHVGRQRAGLVAFSDVAKTEMLPWNFRNRMETTSSLTRRVEILGELASTFHSKAQVRLTRFAERIGPITEGAVIVIVILVVLLIISPILTFIPTMLSTIG